jgi:acyl carrier protein
LTDSAENIQALLEEVAARDIKLWVEDGKLRVNAPQGALLPELKERLSANKPELIELLSQQGDETNSAYLIKTLDRHEAMPLTLGQERIWSLARMEVSSSVYNVPTVFLLGGKPRRDALEFALNEIQRRHEALRTTFEGDSIETVSVKISEHVPFVVPVTDLSRDVAKFDSKQQQKLIDRILQEEVRKPFDLAQGPLWRVRLFVLAPGRNILAFTMHHIIFDGMSKSIFLSELADFYSSVVEDKALQKAELPVQFVDFAAWQRERLTEKVLEKQLDYWRSKFEGEVAPLVTPNQKKRQPQKGKAGSVHLKFPAELSTRLVDFARQEQASLFVLFIAAFDVLMQRYTKQEDILLCAPMASREHADIENLIGYFNNIVVMRSDLSSDPSFKSLLVQVKRLSVEAFDNQFVPLQSLAQLPQLVRTPLTRAMVSFQESSSEHLAMAGLKTKSINVRKGEADFDIALYLERHENLIGGVLDYNADIFHPELIKRLAQRFAHLLADLLKNPDAPLSSLPALGRPIESVQKLLTSHPQIDDAIVVPDVKTGTLNAYLVLNEDDVPELDAIREFAAKSLPDFRVPAAFIPLDEFPLLLDGGVDLAALPKPAADRSRLATAYEAPRSDLEASLAKIWRKVLWLDHDVGVNDQFRELGGHSLLSVQLVHDVEESLGITVPARALAHLDTIANLAYGIENADALAAEDAGRNDIALPMDIYHGLRSHTASWDGKRSSPDAVTVGLNVDGGRPPLFWCLQRYQELTQLARYLDPEQPIYGMRSGNRVMIKTQDNINLLANFYVDEILAVEPNGPFRIGGNCQAALIAFQIALELKRRGYEVALLILHEKFIPCEYDGPVALSFGQDSVYNPKRYYRDAQQGWRKYYSGPMVSREVLGAHGQFFKEPNVQDLVGGIKQHLDDILAQTFASDQASSDVTLQIVPEEGYRAKLVADSMPSLSQGASHTLSVEVHNSSSVRWLNTECSGILLANRWIDAEGRVHREIDGFSELAEPLAAGESTIIVLTVKAPAKSGQWTLEIDMIDEGVTRFSSKGASPCLVSVQVD